MFQHNIFLPLPAFSQRVQYVANGGLILRHVTPGDNGNYSVDITTQDTSGTFFTKFHFINLSVTGIRDVFPVIIAFCASCFARHEEMKIFEKRMFRSSFSKKLNTDS